MKKSRLLLTALLTAALLCLSGAVLGESDEWEFTVLQRPWWSEMKDDLRYESEVRVAADVEDALAIAEIVSSNMDVCPEDYMPMGACYDEGEDVWLIVYSEIGSSGGPSTGGYTIAIAAQTGEVLSVFWEE